MNNNDLIQKAYEAYLEDLKTDDRIKKLNDFDSTLKEFHEKLKDWKATDSVDFIVDFALSPEADIFASSGQGKVATQSFKEFMNLKVVKENLEKLIFYKYNSKDITTMHMKIRENDIREYLEDENVKLERKPLHLVGRLLLLIFPETYTTIAEETLLNDIYARLSKDGSKKNKYLVKQRKVRFEVDKFLKDNNLTNEVTNMTKTGLAWWISQV